MKSIPPLLSVRALRDLLRATNQQKISVLETDIGRQFEKDFQHVHIPKARYYEQLECTKPTKDIPRGLPDLKCFESYLSRLGVSNDDHVVLYDRSPMGLYASSRAWWVLRTLGMQNLSILDGGFYKWMKEVNETESSNDQNSKDASGNFTARLDQNMIKYYEDLLNIATKNNRDQQIVDARPPNLFNGANAGHLPNSFNLPYTSVFDPSNQSLKSIDELKDLFKRIGVDLSKPTIYTCQTGTTASTLAFIAHLLGQKSLSVYNGSFTEWQNRAPKEFIHRDQTNSAAA